MPLFMNKILSTLLQTLSAYRQQPIVVAYSGGVDSQVLLHALYTLQKQGDITNAVRVCHVNHGLSDNANDWAEFASTQCQRLNLPLSVHRLSLEKISGESLEATARDARYQVLISEYEHPAVILTGHHKDDQVETFFLALKRGSGLQGLSAMSTVSPLEHHFLLRPLLTISRQEIEFYAQQQQLSWVEDESNLDNQFDRNFLRNDVLPLLQERWPHIGDAISRSADICRDNQKIVNDVALDDLQRVQGGAHSLKLAVLSQLSKARVFNVLRAFLTQHQVTMPSVAQLEQVYSQLASQEDKTPQVKVGEYWLRRYKNNVILTPSFDDVSGFKESLSMDKLINEGQAVVELPDNLGTLILKSVDGLTNENEHKTFFSVNKDTTLIITFEHSNPIIEPDYRDKSRALKKVLQEMNLPPWERKRLPFIMSEQSLVAVPSYFVCKPFNTDKNDLLFSVLWLDQE